MLNNTGYSSRWRAKNVGVFERYANLRDKRTGIEFYTWNFLNKLMSMFSYTGLPESIPARELETYLLVGGACIFAEFQGELYALEGSLGGEPDAYYRPRKFIVANPYLKLNKEYLINEDCILVKNDHLMLGLMPIVTRYSSLIVENELSIYLTTINQRIQNIITAGDDMQKQGADNFFEDMERGKLGAVVTSDFFEGIKSNPLNTPSGNAISQLVELHQYLKAGLLNEIGIAADSSNKKETIHSAEVAQSAQALLPLVDEMLSQREEALERVNSMFGTNIQVKLNSSWEEQREEIELSKELDEAQIEALENQSQEGTNPENTGEEGGENENDNNS